MMSSVTSDAKTPSAEASTSTFGFTNAGLSKPTAAGMIIDVSRRVARRIGLRELLGESLRGDFGSRAVHTGTHATDGHHPPAAAPFEQVRRAGPRDVVHADRNPDLRPESERAHPAKSARRHARRR